MILSFIKDHPIITIIIVYLIFSLVYLIWELRHAIDLDEHPEYRDDDEEHSN